MRPATKRFRRNAQRIIRTLSHEYHDFVDLVWEMGKTHARNDLPWRFIDDPYAVYISEVMLQQTQVGRVLSYWPQWMSRFPTIDALSSASTSDVLEQWQGLGYNRRALALKKTADICSAQYAGHLPKTVEELLLLPGIGPATAAGIVAFAYQKPSIYIETNVRSVFIHHFFAGETDRVSDARIAPLVEKTCSQDHPREWYYALLDYGAHLKSTIPNPSRKAAAYTRQSAFNGSQRQKRAFIVREVLASPGIDQEELFALLNDSEQAAGRPVVPREVFDDLLDALSQEGFFSVQDGRVFP